jgi:hypothetical protein
VRQPGAQTKNIVRPPETLCAQLNNSKKFKKNMKFCVKKLCAPNVNVVERLITIK